MPSVSDKYTANGPSDGSVLGQRRRRLTGIEQAMGCKAGPTLNRNLVSRRTQQTTDVDPTLANHMRRWPSIKPPLVQRRVCIS